MSNIFFSGQERKKSQQESSPGTQSYQSFSSVETPPANPVVPTSPDTPTEKDPARVQNLYQQFANERDKEEQAGKAGDSPRDKPRSGNTVYVSGNKVTEDFLKKHFIEFGEILNISMEIEKGRGFITFSKTASADRAITEVLVLVCFWVSGCAYSLFSRCSYTAKLLEELHCRFSWPDGNRR